MKAEQKLKILAGRAKSREAFAKQVLKIDKNWTIRRVDSLNWEIQFKGDFYGYYGHLICALNALSGKMLDREAKDALCLTGAIQKGIVERIARSLPDARKLSAVSQPNP